MKLGFEVEGRLKGLYTLFMNSADAVAFFEFKSLKERAFPEGSADSIEKVRHIYVSDHGLENPTLNGMEDCFRIWNDLGLPVTYETTWVGERQSFPPNVTIMLRVERPDADESFWKLRPTDQVKFSRDQLVYCVTKENMSVTMPDEFNGDIEFTARTDERFRKQQ